MDDSTISYIKFLKEVIPVPDPPEPIPDPEPVIPDPSPVIPEPSTIPDVHNAVASTKSEFLNYAVGSFPQTGDPAWWALMAAFVFGVLTIIMAICLFVVPAIVAVRKSNCSKPKFSRANAAMLIGFSLAALLSCGLYYAQTFNNADADVTEAKHICATGEITCTLGPSGQNWTAAQLSNRYPTEDLVLTSVNTQAIDSQLKDLPLNIKYNDLVLFDGKIGDSVALSRALSLKANETIKLTYSIPGDIDYEKFNYDANAFSVEFVSTGSTIHDLVVDGTMYYPALSNTDARWNEIRWYDVNKDMVYGLTCMNDIVNNNIRYYSIDEPSGTTFKGIRAVRESFDEAFGSVPMSGSIESYSPVEEYKGTSQFAGEMCETLTFNRGITSGEPNIDGVPIGSVDAAYNFSGNLEDIYYWTPIPAFMSTATNGRRNYYTNWGSPSGISYPTYTYSSLTSTKGMYPEPDREVFCVKKGRRILDSEKPNPSCWYILGSGNRYGLLSVHTITHANHEVSFPELRTDDALFHMTFWFETAPGGYVYRRFAYAWPVKRNNNLIWGSNDGYAWLRMDSDADYDEDTTFQYMNDTLGDRSDGPDKNNALIVFSRTFCTNGLK